METTIGLDIGTTSVKAVAADGDGNVIARAQVRHALRVPSADRLEHDPAEAWQAGVWAALRALGSPADLGVRAVNVSAMVPSFGAFDAAGQPLTPGLLYGDERGRRYKDPTGASDEGEWQAFLEWGVAAAPGAAHFWPAQAAANHALGGVGAIDTTCCATVSPVWFGTSWNASVIDGMGVAASQLPVVADLGAAVGRVSGTDAVLASGAIDAMGEGIVAGADEPGDVLVILGTTLIVWAVIDDWLEVPKLWTIPSMTVPKMLIGGPSNAGGLFLSWAAGLVPGEGLPADPARVPLWDPAVRGERVPVHDPDRRAGVHGLDLTHDAAACRRAAYEASGFAVRRMLDLAGDAGVLPVAPRRIVVTGGGVRVGQWVQAIADATALPTDVVAVPEGGALGSAWFARMAAGLEPGGMADAPRWARTSHRVDPDPAWAAACAARYPAWRAVAG